MSAEPRAEHGLDLSSCAREPIHTPGAIQPYGVLLVVDPSSMRVVERAVADDDLLAAFGDPLDHPLRDVLGGVLSACASSLQGDDLVAPRYLGRFEIDGHGRFHGLAHRSGGELIVELEAMLADEPATLEELYPAIRDFMTILEKAETVAELCALGAERIRELTGFDRTLVYQFDAEWNGAVIAESRNERLPSYLDLRFPESDIPAQARELYRRNRVRLIPDCDYQSVPLLRSAARVDAAPTDLSLATLRSVSPVHLRYMRNMGTGSSMSVSLVHDGRLWGLISCHHQDPRRVPYHVRTACEFIGQILALQIAQKERASMVEERVSRRATQMRLLGRMSGDGDFVEALKKDQRHLLELTRSTGAALVRRDDCVRFGECPSHAQIAEIVRYVSRLRENQDLYATERLPTEANEFRDLSGVASGVLAISISQLHDSYLLWFRPEVVRTVRWGGDPRKDHVGGMLSPRMSFEIWKETVRHRSVPWDAVDRDAAMELRVAIVDIVLRKAEELAEVNEQLVRTNKELEAFSYSVSHDLRAPFRHIVGYSELLGTSANDRLTGTERRYLDTIVESAKSAGTLVDDLLSFSQLGRSTLGRMPIAMGGLVDDVRQRLEMEYRGRAVAWDIAPLPTVSVDPAMVRLVWQNLISNALKFTREATDPLIRIGYEPGDAEDVFFIRDNGCGFDMRYVDKLFGVFQRLHHVEEYEGTGIGLAHVHRIVTRHGGRIWAEGRVGEGAAFYFSIPH
ncbi:ATP-binding protein [Luteibacter sahnii]|uniref:ATP-binding protein n=1 Tax=Luteibacter sahnii TaxID=3021977 RepID=UPI002A698D8F|nr:ATP-binding protein [Luteibacter sp. PPL193]MDY1547647.1 GAF domain-containing protein [Luteibacter sp. PPL193]